MKFKDNPMMMRRHGAGRWVQTVLAALVVSWGVAGMEARACPNCRDAVAETAGQGAAYGGEAATGSRLADGYNYSILFMIGMMYAVVGGSGLLLWHAVKKYAPPREVLMGQGRE